MIKLGNHDPLDYFPLHKGMPASSAQMTKLPAYDNPEKNKIFQIDNKWHDYRKAKEAVRSNLDMYYQTIDQPKEILQYILNQILKEWPQYFRLTHLENVSILDCSLSKEVISFDQEMSLIPEKCQGNFQFLDLFDALAMQVSEDLVMYKDLPEGHGVSAIHLCHANGWSSDVIGKNFAYIHQDVPHIEKIIPRMEPMTQALMRLPQPIERVGAISWRTDSKLNRHPDLTDDMKPKPFDEENPALHMRVERQTLTSFSTLPGFLFTIKTYFIDCNNSDPIKKQKVIEAFEQPLPEKTYHLKFMTENREKVLRWLKK